MKALNNAQYVQKRSAQSDVKTEQRNKQGMGYEKSYLGSVLLMANSDISHFIWLSVSFSYQKYTKKFPEFENQQNSCNILARF